jgi:hypothetical protein
VQPLGEAVDPAAVGHDLSQTAAIGDVSLRQGPKTPRLPSVSFDGSCVSPFSPAETEEAREPSAGTQPAGSAQARRPAPAPRHQSP